MRMNLDTCRQNINYALYLSDGVLGVVHDLSTVHGEQAEAAAGINRAGLDQSGMCMSVVCRVSGRRSNPKPNLIIDRGGYAKAGKA